LHTELAEPQPEIHAEVVAEFMDAELDDGLSRLRLALDALNAQFGNDEMRQARTG
jgi:hypothetical protein